MTYGPKLDATTELVYDISFTLFLACIDAVRRRMYRVNELIRGCVQAVLITKGFIRCTKIRMLWKELRRFCSMISFFKLQDNHLSFFFYFCSLTVVFESLANAILPGGTRNPLSSIAGCSLGLCTAAYKVHYILNGVFQFATPPWAQLKHNVEFDLEEKKRSFPVVHFSPSPFPLRGLTEVII